MKIPPAKRFSRHFIFGPEGNLLSLNEFSPEKVRGILAECQLPDSRVPVLSQERFAGHPDTGGFDSESICIRLSQVFDSPKIFMVIREQKSLIASCYMAFLTRGGTLALKDYINQPDDWVFPKFSKRFFEFHNLIAMYQKIFGRDSVLVLPYEMFRDEPYKFFGSLRDFSGARMPDSLPIQEKENPHASAFWEPKLRFLNMFARRKSTNAYSPFYMGKFYYKLDRSMRKRLRKVVPGFLEKRARDRHKQIIERLIGDYYRESNIETGKLIGIDLDQYNY